MTGDELSKALMENTEAGVTFQVVKQPLMSVEVQAYVNVLRHEIANQCYRADEYLKTIDEMSVTLRNIERDERTKEDIRKEMIQVLNKLKRFDATGDDYLPGVSMETHRYGEWIRADDIADAFGLAIDSCFSGFSEKS